jgi:hypothetical protein
MALLLEEGEAHEEVHNGSQSPNKSGVELAALRESGRVGSNGSNAKVNSKPQSAGPVMEEEKDMIDLTPDLIEISVNAVTTPAVKKQTDTVV